MAINCEACDDLRKDAPDLLMNGITDKICESLTKNRGLNPNLSTLHTNCEDIKKMISCFIDGHRESLKAADPCDWKKFVEEMLRNLTITLEAMGCSDCGQWLEIDKIWGAIKEIRELIEILLGGGSWRLLTKGVDYDITFFNQFFNPANDVLVRVSVVGTQTYIRVTGTAATSTDLAHNNIEIIKPRHSQNIETVPLSMVYGLVFKGSYAYLNNASFSNTSGNTTGNWNINPRSLRAAWAATCTLTGGALAKDKNQTIISSIMAYHDGYNTDFTVYNASGMNATGINIDVQGTFS